MKATIFFLLLLLATIVPLRAATDDAPLPRRGTIGIQSSVDPESRRLVVRNVIAKLPAEAAGVKSGDVIVSVDGQPMPSNVEFISLLSKKKAGQHAVLTLERDGKPLTLDVTLMGWPQETSKDFDVVYGQVRADGNRYRTIATKPHGNGPFPTLFIVQGLGCGTIDNPPGNISYSNLVRDLTTRGYATLRVDKPGAGDSEGGPCPSVDFWTEVNAYKAALASVAGKPFVDAKNVFLLGHSMGGVMAPMIAAAFPLRALMVYGTEFNSWWFYTMENERRQSRLAGVDPIEIFEGQKSTERFGSLFFVQKLPLEQVVAQMPELREAFPDNTYAAGKEGKYFQQIYDINQAKEWKGVDVPVYAVHGGSDFLCSDEEHRWLAEVVNQYHPGKGTFYRLEGVDHWFAKAADAKASMDREEKGGKFEYDPRVSDLVANWMKKWTAKA